MPFIRFRDEVAEFGFGDEMPAPAQQENGFCLPATSLKVEHPCAMEMDAQMLVDGVSITEEALFGGPRQWHFSCLEDAAHALAPGGAITRRRASTLNCVIEKRFVVGRGSKGFDKTERVRVKKNEGLLDVLEQIICERIYWDLNQIIQAARGQPENVAVATLEAAAELGETGHALSAQLQARGLAAKDITLALAACYGELVQREEASSSEEVSVARPPQTPLPPLGHPDRPRARRQRFLDGAWGREHPPSTAQKFERYRERFRELSSAVRSAR
jgi:hypothetical protein